MSAIDPAWFPVYHAYGTKACDGIAFYTTRRVHEGDIIEPSEVRHLDGRPAVFGDRPACEACGATGDMSTHWPWSYRDD